MKTVYVVTEGSYSAYNICAVFSTKELAERYVEHDRQQNQYYCSGTERPEIEEWPLDEHCEKLVI